MQLFSIVYLTLLAFRQKKNLEAILRLQFSPSKFLADPKLSFEEAQRSHRCPPMNLNSRAPIL